MGGGATHASGGFDSESMVAAYSAVTPELTPAEVVALGDLPRPDERVLDLGVGTGRTVPELRRRARSYVGLDVSPRMIETARRLHPGADLRVGDASELTAFGDGAFDLVLFSYNGIDYLTGDARRRCWSEVRRVIAVGGRFVFSSHNARAILRRPARPPSVRSVAVAGYQTARRLRRVDAWSAWRHGVGYVVDPVNGLDTWTSTPPIVIAELGSAGFRHELTVAGDHPLPPRGVMTPWWYYGFTAVDTDR